MNDPHRFDDLFCEFGPIRLRRFFGGEGIYTGETMIGSIFRDVLYFKTDDDTRKAFDAEGCKAFTFTKGKELIVTSWRAIPDRLYDDPAELAQWARAALGVALASPTARKKARAATSRARPRKKR
ncbi:MAG TPA: TfoX/Sxy family protein [Rhizomicrobium sp.]|jgi:DNA transformation protein|nr:TfoX/Sxy family protein [Rhizomicrobium sp.]